jgi:hypothetical protein
MATNPVIRFGSKQAHTQTTVLGASTKKKPADSRYSLRLLSDHCQKK